jgi:hypothetical protein
LLEIGKGAFYSSNIHTKVYRIPLSVTTIGDSIFINNPDITDVWIYQTNVTKYYDSYGKPGAFGNQRLMASKS